jgi:hypothetical protein
VIRKSLPDPPATLGPGRQYRAYREAPGSFQSTVLTVSPSLPVWPDKPTHFVFVGMSVPVCLRCVHRETVTKAIAHFCQRVHATYR